MALIVDNAYSLIVELKDDDLKEASEEAIELATYSNSQSTVLAYVSIFEMMWMQSELKYHGSNNTKKPQQKQKEQSHRTTMHNTQQIPNEQREIEQSKSFY
jgi:PIN domain nuclease of toxin-antitoxin system